MMIDPSCKLNIVRKHVPRTLMSWVEELIEYTLHSYLIYRSRLSTDRTNLAARKGLSGAIHQGRLPAAFIRYAYELQTSRPAGLQIINIFCCQVVS